MAKPKVEVRANTQHRNESLRFYSGQDYSQRRSLRPTRRGTARIGHSFFFLTCCRSHESSDFLLKESLKAQEYDSGVRPRPFVILGSPPARLSILSSSTLPNLACAPDEECNQITRTPDCPIKSRKEGCTNSEPAGTRENRKSGGPCSRVGRKEGRKGLSLSLMRTPTRADTN